MDPFSPRKFGSNILNHLAESRVDSSRHAIKEDLVGKVIYDDQDVFRRLRIDEVDNTFVANCAESFKDHNEEDLATLRSLVSKASKKAPDVLETEEIDDKKNDPNKEERSGNHGSPEEKKMYDPLVRLFNYIANFDQDGGPRTIQKTNGMLKPDESHTFGFPSVSPDLTLSPHGINASESKLWRHRDAFGEVKASNAQGPKGARLSTVPPIVVQSADYARLFLSARPFMLFCVGLLIFGTEFCIGIFDRDGIVFSPICDMFEDTDMLIRVVRSLMSELSIQELGFDPTVRPLTDLETQELFGGSAEYPSAVVSSGGNRPRNWCTIGPPIWTSLSLMGRGTNVWRVREYVLDDNGKPFLRKNKMIMKTAWRNSGRLSESDIYLSITAPPVGLAKFECGGDVMFDKTSPAYPITVQNLRRHPVHSSLPEDDAHSTPVLHRLVLRTVGRAIWEYTSDLDLLTGFRDALQAHKELCEMHILHRDISAGNVLLSETQDGLLRGFITDVEFAHIKSATLLQPRITVTTTFPIQAQYNSRGELLANRTNSTTRTHTWFESEIKVKRGAGMTGTAQFMARALLNANNPSMFAVDAETLVHKPEHDVESFIWVLSYSVMRNIYKRASQRSAPQEVRDQCYNLRSLLNRAFGQTTAINIAYERHSDSPAMDFPMQHGVNAIVMAFMSQPLVQVFTQLRRLVIRTNYLLLLEDSKPLTHDAVLAVINEAITSLVIGS